MLMRQHVLLCVYAIYQFIVFTLGLVNYSQKQQKPTTLGLWVCRQNFCQRVSILKQHSQLCSFTLNTSLLFTPLLAVQEKNTRSMYVHLSRGLFLTRKQKFYISLRSEEKIYRHKKNSLLGRLFFARTRISIPSSHMSV